jgi:UDP-N-acetylmuramoyl-L-alanyl-D-glutamate--2,6-diaminopimelate ligase
MNLALAGKLLGVSTPSGSSTVSIADLAYDSRRASPGCLFFCIRGAYQDGHRWARQAIHAGAAALVTEQPLHFGVPELVVPDSRAAMNRLASPFFREPSLEVDVVGITGTNGKTTIAFLLESIFRANGEKAGLVGTVETRVAGEVLPAARTTPEAIDLQRILRRMADSGVSRCALEVTSIGIERGRTEGLHFSGAVFTNLTHDHLDHHGTMERYYLAKKRLFETPPGGRRSPIGWGSVINLDDPYGRRLITELMGQWGEGDSEAPRLLTYGLDSPADLLATNVAMGRDGSTFRASGPGFDVEVLVRLPGAFNVYNSLAAIGAAYLAGISVEVAAEGIAGLPYVPGRFEPVDEGQDFAVLVDYAHTPDSLANVLSAARQLTEGRVIAVFGCGGDRDRAKRPVMGEVASTYADLVVATSDNPRSESPSAILAEIEQGLKKASPPDGYSIVPDRAEAIGIAVRKAGKGDVVVIAGKGHEKGQEFADRVMPFDDRLVAAEALRNLH